MKILVIVILFVSCLESKPIILITQIPITASFKDSSDVFIAGQSKGILVVTQTLSDKFLAKIIFDNGVKIPKSSVVLYHENPLGRSYFEIKLGAATIYLKSNDEIEFENHQTKDENDKLKKNHHYS